ncbi:MAG: extracellular solute-binding protein [Candidatus Aquilonibacter sp.]
MNRRNWIGATFGLAGIALTPKAFAQGLTPLDVAYAGSMGSMMEGPVKAAVAKTLGIDMHGRAQGSDALAQLIVGGSIPVDVFVSVTPGPMTTVLKAGKALHALPVARTEMVIAYSPKSAFASAFANAGKPGAMPWYQILQQPGVRFGRTDPATDPQGRNIIFTMQLAEAYYKQPALAQKILGDTINAAQIFAEPTVEARLQSGELDAASAYRIQPGPFGLPFIALPDEINLGNQSMHAGYASATLELGGKTYHPQALVYYAATIVGATHPEKAAALVQWFSSPEALAILRKYDYDPPVGAAVL